MWLYFFLCSPHAPLPPPSPDRGPCPQVTYVRFLLIPSPSSVQPPSLPPGGCQSVQASSPLFLFGALDPACQWDHLLSVCSFQKFGCCISVGFSWGLTRLGVTPLSGEVVEHYFLAHWSGDSLPRPSQETPHPPPVRGMLGRW